MIDLSQVPAGAFYHPRRHAAVRTDEYVFSQLIPYIGNKRKLLPLISRGIACTGLREGVFIDLFSGSSVVGRLAKTLGFRVAANDWEPYAHEIARGTVSLNRAPAFAGLGGVERVFDELNAAEPLHGYVAEHLCPRDDSHPDPSRERMFFTRENGERIDAMRECIAAWEADGRLSPDERAFLLSALIYSVSYVSNTSGVFKGFHDGWGGQTGTALYRIRSVLRVRPPVVFDNRQRNVSWREDAQLLAKDLVFRLGRWPDIVYVDPPYNQHPYGSNYHVLNTVALWDKPTVSPRVRVDGKVRDKSAIRKDWRTERRSPYNSARTALPAFRALIGAIEARWILVSYSTDGNVPVADLLPVLADRGDLRVFTRRYKRYRVSTPRMSPRPHNVEFLAVLDAEGKPSGARVGALIDQITNQEEALEREVTTITDP